MKSIYFNLLLLLLLVSCKNDSKPAFLNALTFHASFDEGVSADFASGDEKLYTAMNWDQLDEAVPGLQNADHGIVEDGKWGNALRFGRKSDTVVFYQAKDNIKYDPKGWSGTISFWLSLDPAADLAPGYTDPVQITDVRYDDAAIWVDFTNENPRDFRLGILGDREEWEQDTLQSSPQEEFERRLVWVKDPPFKRETWTHVLIVFESLGTSESVYTLYLDNQSQGSVEGIDDPFTWDLDDAKIFIGLNFIGRMDELSIFDRPLTDSERSELSALERGLTGIVNAL